MLDWPDTCTHERDETADDFEPVPFEEALSSEPCHLSLFEYVQLGLGDLAERDGDEGALFRGGDDVVYDDLDPIPLDCSRHDAEFPLNDWSFDPNSTENLLRALDSASLPIDPLEKREPTGASVMPRHFCEPRSPARDSPWPANENEKRRTQSAAPNSTENLLRALDAASVLTDADDAPSLRRREPSGPSAILRHFCETRSPHSPCPASENEERPTEPAFHLLGVDDDTPPSFTHDEGKSSGPSAILPHFSDHFCERSPVGVHVNTEEDAPPPVSNEKKRSCEDVVQPPAKKRCAEDNDSGVAGTTDSEHDKSNQKHQSCEDTAQSPATKKNGRAEDDDTKASNVVTDSVKDQANEKEKRKSCEPAAQSPARKKKRVDDDDSKAPYVVTDSEQDHDQIVSKSSSKKSKHTKPPAKTAADVKADKEKIWNEFYAQLVAFKEKHGNCLVSSNCKENVKLALWAKRQRCHYAAKQRLQTDGGAKTKSPISEERVAKLTELGFVWEVKKAIWEEKYNQLCAYKKKHGDCNVNVRSKQYPQLAIFVKCQRRLFQQHIDPNCPVTIPRDRIERLNAIGFSWCRRLKQTLIAEQLTFVQDSASDSTS